MINYLIFIIGLPCSGKSTVAQMISQEKGFTHFATEDIRAEFLGENLLDHEDCDFTNEQQEYVYNEIAKRALSVLSNGQSVIVEGVYRSNTQRQIMLDIANELSIKVIPKFYWFTCEENETIRRLIKRKEMGTQAPAGVVGYKKIKQEFEIPNEDIFVKVDTTFGTNNVAEKIIKEIGR